MKTSPAKFLKAVFPFLTVLLLWRLSVPFWNPGGILAIIPIFYYSFINPVAGFSLFAVLSCFLIDYKFDSLLFWTSIYCLFYAVNGFQSFVDLTRQKNDGVLVFMGFFGASALILSLMGFSFQNLIHVVWLILWSGILYIPFTAIAKRIKND